jgi:protein required for attachment to host cells
MAGSQKMEKYPRKWYLVADQGRARILTGRVRTGHGELVTSLDSPALHAKTHDLGSERPGHGAESVGHARHAVEAPDYHGKAGDEFAKALATVIDQGLAADAFDQLVLVAPPRFLGRLRDALSAPALDRVTDTLPKDLTHVAINDLGPHIAELPTVHPAG